MTAPKPPPKSQDQVRDARAERLAAALRENLKRRKAQTRAQAGIKAPPKDDGK